MNDKITGQCNEIGIFRSHRRHQLVEEIVILPGAIVKICELGDPEAIQSLWPPRKPQFPAGYRQQTGFDTSRPDEGRNANAEQSQCGASLPSFKSGLWLGSGHVQKGSTE